MRKSGLLLTILLLCVSLTGCSEISKLVHDISSSDNPLSGKDTDERIIMCLEEQYPEHDFSVVESFDKENGAGIFQDEQGIEFRVHNLVYDNIYHFGCDNDYLAELLKTQDYFDSLEKISSKYGYILSVDEINENVGFDTENHNLEDNDFTGYVAMIREILNSVDMPETVYPADMGFSTGEVNYYTRPCFGSIMCKISYQEHSRLVIFRFGDEDLPEERLVNRFRNDSYLLLSGDYPEKLTPEVLYSADNNIDMFVCDNSAYINAEDADWVETDDLIKDDCCGEIGKSRVTDTFENWDATKLPTGTKIYRTNDNNILLADCENQMIPYVKIPYMWYA